MSKNVKPSFTRRSLRLQTREFVLIATEGAVTEKEYIDAVVACFQQKAKERFGKNVVVSRKYVSSNHRSVPTARLRALKREASLNRIDDNYTAWLICDLDQWNSEQFHEIKTWEEKNKARNHWILNSPNFEFWLSLHFKNTAEFQKYVKRNGKRVGTNDFTYEDIVKACSRARSSYPRDSSLFEQDGSRMFLFIEYLAKFFGLEADFQ